MISRKCRIIFCLFLSSALYTLPVSKALSEDDIGNLIQHIENKETGGTEAQTQAPAVSKPVKVEDIYTSLAKPVEKESYTGKKISLDLQDADVVNVLRLLADVGGVNIVFGGDVSGKVTVNLKNIPWDQALDIVLMTNGLDKVRMGNIIRVARSETITDEANKRLAAIKASDKVEAMSTRIIPVNYSDIKTIKESELIKNILSDRGKIDIDARTNTLIVNDIGKNVEQIATLVKRLDTRIPQVLIEARIVEAREGFARDIGVQWGYAQGYMKKDTRYNIFGGNTGGAFTGLTFTPDPVTGEPRSVLAGQPTLPINYNVNLPAANISGAGGTFGFNIGRIFDDSIYALDMRLSLAEQNNNAKVISSPRVMTVDNKEANIVQGEDIPYETISRNGTQVQFVEANLELTVTPHVTSDNTILLEVETHRDAPNFEDAVEGRPAITRNKAQTSVLLSDGETTVIGGIYIVDKADSNNGIPFLKDLPYIGYFFRVKHKEVTKKEMLVFITPKIIR